MGLIGFVGAEEKGVGGEGNEHKQEQVAMKRGWWVMVFASHSCGFDMHWPHVA